MMMRLAIALAALAACGDGLSLEVRVQHPPEAAIATTRITIYESGSATCRQLEYGDLSDAELESLRVAEEVVGSGDGLDGISRVDRKLVVARGFDAQGRFATGGCVEHGEIVGHDTADVVTDFAVDVSVGAFGGSGGSGGSGGMMPGIPVALTDAEGRSRDGHAVSWRVYGPHGAAPSPMPSGAQLAAADDDSWELASPTCTSAAGVVRLHPVPPATVGGYAIELRPRWSREPNTLLTSFTRIDPTLTVFEPNPKVLHPCAIRVAGGVRRLVCLQLAAAGGAAIAREYEVAVSGGNARLTLRTTAAVDPGVVAAFAVPRGADRDVYAVTADAKVVGLFNPGVAPDPDPHLALGQVTDALLQPACAAGQAERLLLRIATPTGRRVQAMPPLGGPLSDYHAIATESPLVPIALRAAGCVTELAPSGGMPRRRQAAVIDVNQRVVDADQRTTTSVVFECDLPDPAKCRATLPVAATGAGLSAPGAAEPQLTGMFFDATGVVMSSWVLLPTHDGAFLLVERGRVPAASIPNRVVTGEFDGDGKPDLMWDFTALAQATSNFQATYGRMIGERRLSALSGAEPILVDDMITGDLTGDGLDDLVIVGRQRREDDLGNITITSGLIVVPMGVPAPNPDPLFDAPCGSS